MGFYIRKKWGDTQWVSARHHGEKKWSPAFTKIGKPLEVGFQLL
jgi:hypothetical protein